MENKKPDYGLEDLIVVDYTGGYNTQQAINSIKRKRDMDSGVVAEEEVEEALTINQRRKLKLAMRRNKAKIKRGRKLAMRRKPRVGDIERRSRKRAISSVKKKLAKGKDLSSLSPGQRSNIEKRARKKQGLVKRIQRQARRDIRKGN